MKKKYFMFLLSSFALTSLHAQQKFDMYCKVLVGEFYFGKHVGWKDTALLSFGKEPDLLSGNRMDTLTLKQVEKRKTDVDVLNFMSSQGWEVVGGTPTEGWGVGNSTHQTFFYFHKRFEK